MRGVEPAFVIKIGSLRLLLKVEALGLHRASLPDHHGLGFRVQGLGLWGFRVQGLGFRVLATGITLFRAMVL